MYLLGELCMRIFAKFAFLMLCATTGGQLFGQGIVLPASGAVNRGMAGAAVAAPLDAMGALYWNPATISGLEKSELSANFELLLPTYDVSSSIPGVGAGSTGAEPGVSPIPNIGWVHKTQNEGLTFGLGLQTVAGYYANTPADSSNPVLDAPPAGFASPAGLGRFAGQAIYLQMAPVVSYAVSERLSFAAGPVVTLGNVSSNVNYFSTPNANGLYPTGNGTRYMWGGGFQLGTYYIHNDCLRFGASYKSPSWMEHFRYHSEDATGAPRVLSSNFDLPMIVSIGTAFSPSEETVFALDVRYLDYENADGFGDEAKFNPDFSVVGLGWRSQTSVVIGAQHQLSEVLYVRAGYMFATELVDDADAFFNLGANLGYQHIASLGATVKLNENLALNMAYSYAATSSIEGPVVTAVNTPVPGSSVRNAINVHVVTLGISVGY
jgi:long-chain fatty acid transport protein